MTDKRSKPSKTVHGTVLFLPRIYDETLMLLAEAHSYFETQGLLQQRLMSERRRAMFISEMSRITLRLSCVMAWLLAQRAALEGDNVKNKTGEPPTLECRDVCTHQHIEAESLLPDTMTDFLDKTYELYIRIARLDDANHKPENPSTNPLDFA